MSFLNITDAGNTSILPIDAHSKQVSEGSSQVLIGLNSQGICRRSTENTVSDLNEEKRHFMQNLTASNLLCSGQ